METGFLKMISYFFAAQILALLDTITKSKVVEESDVTLFTPLNPMYYVKYPLAIVSIILGFMQFILLLKGFDEGGKLTGNSSIASVSYAAFLFVFSLFIIINYLAFSLVRREYITQKNWELIFAIVLVQLIGAFLAWLLGNNFTENKT